MKLSHKIRNAVVFIVFLALISIPVVCIFLLSSAEQKSYLAGEVKPHTSLSYGELIAPSYQDFEELYTISGTYEPYEAFVQELDANTALIISVGDEVHTGNVIGYCGEQPVLATGNGILREKAETYLCFDSLDSAIFVGNVDPLVAKRLFTWDKGLTTSTGETVTPYFCSSLVQNGTVQVKFLVDGDHACGESVPVFAVRTGRVYRQILALPDNCVYKKSDGMYYVRVVNGDQVIEKPVIVDMRAGNYLSVVGVEETDLCDSGYKSAFGFGS